MKTQLPVRNKLGVVSILKGAQRLFEVCVWRRKASEHQGPGIPSQRILQKQNQILIDVKKRWEGIRYCVSKAVLNKPELSYLHQNIKNKNKFELQWCTNSRRDGFGRDWFHYCVSWDLLNKPEPSIPKNPRQKKTI